ncbi:hypothetical protein Csa_012971 [Cucumis sativus]|uniref:Uncharacterized protein n=1 Tax=Cucumis sativus TaxID=3659 RepID=A0A0A0KY81_CUCSA|nr:hypothetical protein Csa_012971 [Cucumis sativus]
MNEGATRSINVSGGVTQARWSPSGHHVAAHATCKSGSMLAEAGELVALVEGLPFIELVGISKM